jgi:hypothetical protein
MQITTVLCTALSFISCSGCEPCTCCAGGAIAAKLAIEVAAGITVAVAADMITDEIRENRADAQQGASTAKAEAAVEAERAQVEKDAPQPRVPAGK